MIRTVVLVVLLTPAVLVGCVLVDVVCDLFDSHVRNRRLRRLRTRTVVRPRGAVSSPDCRGECSPRLAAAHTRRRRP